MTMYRFRCYRPSPPPDYYDLGAANPPDQVQFEGVLSSDGRCAVFWLTEHRSVSVWPDLASMIAVHGHPEYGSRFEWLDGIPPAVLAEGDVIHVRAAGELT